MILVLRATTVTRIGACAQSPTLPLLLANLQAFGLPQSMHPLDVYRPPVVTQQHRDPTVTEPRPLQRQPVHRVN